jgi:hypothetical protein
MTNDTRHVTLVTYPVIKGLDCDLSSLLVFSELGNKSSMTCVISDAGTVTLPEYLSSLLVFSELGNKSNMTCVISDAGTVTLPEYSSSHLAFSELGLTQSLVSFVVFCSSR